MKPEKLATLTNDELLTRKKSLKSTHKFIVATGVVSLFILCLLFGYYVGKDAATGGKGEFYYKPMLPFVLFFIIGNFVIVSEQKSINEEIKKRNLDWSELRFDRNDAFQQSCRFEEAMRGTTSIGIQLIRAQYLQRTEVFYWQEGNNDVDFVLKNSIKWLGLK